MGCLLPLTGSDGRAAVPSHGPPGQGGELSEDGLCLHPQKVLCQGCLLSLLLVPAHVLFQLLEEACGARTVGAGWSLGSVWGASPGLRVNKVSG